MALHKPKFHYADFATKSGTSSRKTRELVADTNYESPRHKSCRRLSWFVSATSPRLCRRLSACKPNSVRARQTGLSRTCHRLCRKHLDMSGWFVDAINVKNNVNNNKMVFSADNHALIKLLWQEKVYDVRKFIAEFQSKPWTLSGLNKLLRKIDVACFGVT